MSATSIRELVPRVRRAVEGPVPLPNPLSDDVLKDMVADALADVILYTGTAFGKKLAVTARDPDTNAPSEYETSEELTLEEQAVIAAQAALNYYFFTMAGQKTAERISDEGGSWEWQTSATLLRDMFAALKEARDKALEALRSADAPLDTYASFLAVRDAEVARCIEPWTEPEPGTLYGSHVAVVLEQDFRFGGV